MARANSIATAAAVAAAGALGVLAAPATASAGALGFRAYPLYTQCNASWGTDPMGTTGPGERSTICGEGCAMSSLSMALAGLGYTIDGQGANPATLNSWLEANNGYTCAAGDCNNLVLDAVTGLAPSVTLIGEVPPPPVEMIQAGLTAGDVLFLAHVRNRTHFVLLTGYDPATPGQFWVNDPFYNVSAYPYGNISDIIMYYVGAGDAATPAVPRVYVDGAVVAANRFGPAGTASFRGLVAPTHAAAAAKQVVKHVRGVVAAPDPIIPYKYPLYKQCDPRWGNNLMVTETICAVGCLMSSTSMAVAGKNITITRALSTPATMNVFLQKNGGYNSDNDMDEAVVPAINPSHISWPSDGMHTKNDIPLTTIQGYLKAGRPVIAWVMNGQHFVLVIGWDNNNPDSLYVNDPGFDNLTYSYSKDVVGWRLFEMTACPTGC